jgi:hypothetical protein
MEGVSYEIYCKSDADRPGKYNFWVYGPIDLAMFRIYRLRQDMIVKIKESDK